MPPASSATRANATSRCAGWVTTDSVDTSVELDHLGAGPIADVGDRHPHLDDAIGADLRGDVEVGQVEAGVAETLAERELWCRRHVEVLHAPDDGVAPVPAVGSLVVEHGELAAMARDGVGQLAARVDLAEQHSRHRLRARLTRERPDDECSCREHRRRERIGATLDEDRDARCSGRHHRVGQLALHVRQGDVGRIGAFALGAAADRCAVPAESENDDIGLAGRGHRPFERALLEMVPQSAAGLDDHVGAGEVADLLGQRPGAVPQPDVGLGVELGGVGAFGVGSEVLGAFQVAEAARLHEPVHLAADRVGVGPELLPRLEPERTDDRHLLT